MLMYWYILTGNTDIDRYNTYIGILLCVCQCLCVCKRYIDILRLTLTLITSLMFRSFHTNETTSSATLLRYSCFSWCVFSSSSAQSSISSLKCFMPRTCIVAKMVYPYVTNFKKSDTSVCLTSVLV